MSLDKFKALLDEEVRIQRRWNALYDWVNVYTDRVLHARLLNMSSRNHSARRLFVIDGLYLVKTTIHMLAPCSSTVHGDHELEYTRYQADPRMADIYRALFTFRNDETAWEFRREMESYIAHLNKTHEQVLADLYAELHELAQDMPIERTDEPHTIMSASVTKFLTYGAAAGFYARTRLELEGELAARPAGLVYTVLSPNFDDGLLTFELAAYTTPFGWQIAKHKADRSPAAITAVCRRLRVNPRVYYPQHPETP